MGRIAISAILLVLIAPLAVAETQTSTTNQPSVPSASAPTPLSTPSSEQTAQPSALTTGVSTPSPSIAPAAPPADEPNGRSPEIWSRPEPGQNRNNWGAPFEPPPPTDASPQPYSYHRRYYRDEPDSGDSLTELGLTLGPPTILNLNLGYWGSRSLPLVFRLSGMYYSSTRGIQLDVGYVFDRQAHFKQYVGVSAVSWQAATNFYGFWTNGSTAYKDMFTGIGPTYGLNYFGFSFQIGLSVGQDVNTQSYSGGASYNYLGAPVYNAPGVSTDSQFEPQVIFQFGYTFLF